MADIKFRNLISTNTGVGATTGKETAQFFNENFKITKENLEAIWAILNTVVVSPNIEGIRVRPVMDPENPDMVLYSIFEYNLDGDLENGDWFPLEVLFENLVGDVMQNPQLKLIIEGLTPLTRFEPVEEQVGKNTSQISQNKANIEELQDNDVVQDNRLTDLETLTEKQQESLRTKANQVLEMFDIVAKGSGYKVGTTIYDQASTYVLEVMTVDNDGGILSVKMSTASEANPYYIVIDNPGADYQVGDIIPTTDQTWNALVTLVDANGAILQADLTIETPTTSIGRYAELHASNGSGAIVSTTTYPTIYFQSINDGLQDKIIYYLNGDLSTPHEIVAYPDFVNVQKIIDASTDTYYSTVYRADCEFALDYQIGDSFTIDGTGWSGTITDISTDPYTVTCDIPVNFSSDIAGTYTTTATSGSGTGLRIIIETEFHPQTTTNAEFNTYMENHDLYLISLIENAVQDAVDMITNLLKLKVDVADFEIHLQDYDNPHHVTKETIGLDQVDNTSDMDKPISSAVQTELNLLNAQFANLKQMRVVSTAYYRYLEQAGLVEDNVLYNVGNHNSTFTNRSTLDVTSITSPYSNGDVLQINGTAWQIVLIDVSNTPMIYSTNLDAVTEYDLTGTYSTTALTGTGVGLRIDIESTEW